MNKTVLITGGSRGIGLAIALRFASKGCNIAILTKDSMENINEACKQIALAGGQVLALAVDVTQAKELKEAVTKCVDRFDGNKCTSRLLSLTALLSLSEKS